MPDLGAVLALLAAAAFGTLVGMRIVARRRRPAAGLLTPRLPHLRPTWGDRGFLRMPPVKARYGALVQVEESSLAEGPHMWLCVSNHDAPTELELDQAVSLAEQILALARWHYQIAPSVERQHVKREAIQAALGAS